MFLAALPMSVIYAYREGYKLQQDYCTKIIKFCAYIIYYAQFIHRSRIYRLADASKTIERDIICNNNMCQTYMEELYEKNYETDSSKQNTKEYFSDAMILFLFFYFSALLFFFYFSAFLMWPQEL